MLLIHNVNKIHHLFVVPMLQSLRESQCNDDGYSSGKMGQESNEEKDLEKARTLQCRVQIELYSVGSRSPAILTTDVKTCQVPKRSLAIGNCSGSDMTFSFMIDGAVYQEDRLERLVISQGVCHRFG